MELSPLYTGAPTQEDMRKIAEAELFVKVAASQNIDISQLNDAQVSELYGEFLKAAEDQEHNDEEEKEKKEEEEKKEAAAREHAQKLAFAQEEQKAQHMGTVMADAYIDRLEKRGMALTKEGAPHGLPAPSMRRNAGHAVKAVRQAFSDVAHAAGKKGRDIARNARDAGRHVSEHRHAYGAGAGAAAAAGGAGFAAGHHSGHKKEGSSMIDNLALEHAVKVAADSGFFPTEAALTDLATRMDALHTLGSVEETKLAATLDEQVHLRALEYLEAAGCQVNWG